jgi:low temperature requirement protein LtrA
MARDSTPPPPASDAEAPRYRGTPVATQTKPEFDQVDVETGEDRATAPVELLWDLVFVFTVTQVTTLLLAHLSWAGFGRSMLMLSLVWWAWSAFVWAANAHHAESRTLRAALLLALLLIFIVGLTIPQAFGADATLFATAYTGVRFVHPGALCRRVAARPRVMERDRRFLRSQSRSAWGF